MREKRMHLFLQADQKRRTKFLRSLTCRALDKIINFDSLNRSLATMLALILLWGDRSEDATAKKDTAGILHFLDILLYPKSSNLVS